MPIKWDRPRAERMVKQLYTDLFNRAPERDVLRGLVEYLADGRISVRVQVMRMLKSEEFFDKRLRHKTPEDMARALGAVARITCAPPSFCSSAAASELPASI